MSMSSNPANEQEKIFASYVAGKKLLIADASSVARSAIAQCLNQLGVKTQDILLAPSFESALEEIQNSRPHVVICDYDLGRGVGLELLDHQRRARPGIKDTLFILATGNTSQTAVARSAEEDVDHYIVKPFTAPSLKASILKAAIAKIRPPKYLQEIERGKVLLTEGRFEDATAAFEGAKGLDPSPSLACYYLGQTDALQKAYQDAMTDYNEGLSHNQLHYKCMVGLYEIFMNQGEHQRAYQVIRKIARYFPANPQRFNNVLRLAVQTGHYSDVEKYYEIFKGMEQRNEEMVRHVCAALVICGKNYLNQKENDRAIEIMQKAAATGTGRVKLLRKIITTLVDHELFDHAENFLGKFPPEDQSGLDYAAANTLLTDRMQGPSFAIARARDYIKQGIHDPLIYSILIQRSFEAGFDESAEKLVRVAISQWPDHQEEFQALADNSVKKPSHS